MFFLAAATTASMSMTPAASQAQQVHPPVVAATGAVAVLDTEQVVRSCRECRVASAALQARAEALQARAAHLTSLLTTESRALQALVATLPQGSQPDPALRARLVAFQSARDSAEREIAERRAQLQRDVQFVREQIVARMEPAVATAMHQRGATRFVDRGSNADAGGRIDITEAVLAIVDGNNEAFELRAPPLAADRSPADRHQAGGDAG